MHLVAGWVATKAVYSAGNWAAHSAAKMAATMADNLVAHLVATMVATMVGHSVDLKAATRDVKKVVCWAAH